MTPEDRYGGFTPKRATKFFLPLLLQAFAQSLTYPLVASIVAHGKFGVNTLTAFAQGQTVMFMVGALAGGLVLTGMVFAKSLPGYRSFVRLNRSMMVALVSLQIILAIPPLDSLIFSRLLNLPPELAPIAAQTLLWGAIMQTCFFLRNEPLVVLFNARASMEANLATLFRIAVTAAAPLAFIPLGMTGAMWGLAATTFPCLLEYLLTLRFARKYVRELPASLPAPADAPPSSTSAPSQFRFTLPLSFGSFLLAAAPFMIAAFVGRSADAPMMLAIHYVTIGIANPVGYASLRMQPVAVQFPPEYPGDNRVVRYAACAGLILGILPLLAALPCIGNWYFGAVQNMPAPYLPQTRAVMACYAAWPVMQCVRGHAEGLAARLKRPLAVLCGQIAYLSTLIAVLAAALAANLPGHFMGMSAILSSTLVSTLTIHSLLRHQHIGSVKRASSQARCTFH